MNEQARRLLFSEKNGLLPEAVLVDGFVSGNWRLREEHQKTMLTVKAFTRLPRSTEAALEEEVRRLLERIAPPGAHRDYRVEKH
jgi:hypothetical protein